MGAGISGGNGPPLLAPAGRVDAASSNRPSGHIPALDGIRGIAAASVFIYHYGGGTRSSNIAIHFIGETIHLGWAGVSLFFVLSGFLITGILLDTMHRAKWWRAFYLRRALRIFPLYYFALVGALLVNLLLRIPRSYLLPAWPLFFYLQDFPGVVRSETLSPLLFVGHLWSLAVEEQFYLVWPFLLLIAYRRGKVRQLCVAIFLASFLFRICIFGLHLNPEWAVYFIGGRAGEMAVGGLLAAYLRGSQFERVRVPKWAKYSLAASGTILLMVVLSTKETAATGPWLGTLGIALFGQLFAALIALSLQPGFLQRIFSFGILRWLGKISYGIYVYHLLLHPLFVSLTHQLFPDSTGDEYQLVLAAVAMVGTLAAASLSFAILESPFLRLKDSLVKPHRALADGPLQPKEQTP